MLNFFIFMVTMALIIAVGTLINTWLHTRHHPAASSGAESERLAEQNAGLARAVERLERRMAVIEQIATDQPDRLTAEIERLS